MSSRRRASGKIAAGMASDKSMQDLRETVQQLETALATTKDTMQQLQEALSTREEEVMRLRQMLSGTQKERDELRGWNAELVNKLAVVGRRQSTSSASPIFRSTESSFSLNSPLTASPISSPSHAHSSPSRSHSVVTRRSVKMDSPLPPLPPPTEDKPAVEDEGSDTEYCDLENETTDSDVKTVKVEDRRSTSPARSTPTTDGSPHRKISQPKPITRNPGKPSAHPPVNIASPKKVIALSNYGLSRISEEGSPEKDRQGRESGKERLRSECSSEGFESSMETSVEDGFPSVQRFRGATMSVTDFKRPCSQRVDLSSAEAEDVLDKDTNYKRMRSRVSTIASSTGKEYRRKNSRQLHKEAAKLERSPNFRSGGRKFQPLELFSPDMELRIREKICNGIGKKYGGIRRATQAAIVIQTAYRQYKLKKRYNEIRKEALEVRKRAQTMKHPHRSQSMVRRHRPLRYNRQVTALAANDPLLKTKLLSQELGQEGIPHTSSRLHLVEKTRSALSISQEREAQTSPRDSETEHKVVEMETVVCEVTLQEVEAAPPLKADGAATEATDVLLTSEGYRRPLSVFSMRPSVSMDTALMANVSSDEDHMIQTVSQKPMPPDVRQRKMNAGINHFNRKPTRGIQYLVKEQVLPDSPQHVASFLAKQDGLSKEKIGEFVGEISSEFHMAVLECLLEQMEMKDKPIDEALRDFQILFRMPGEAQKIDKIMQMFALEYFRFNKDGLIKSEDAAYILSFAIMMLHTSLHNPSVKTRTTKKQWVSMNRGCNDDDNFPVPFLHDIYDRIGKHEFITGKDHTNIVCEIERNLVGYQTTSRLAVPQRKLVYRASVTEIDELTSRPSFKTKTKRRRIFFLFSDQVIVCKRRGGEQLEYKHSFILLDAIAVSFETHHYRHGVQILSSHDGKTIFQCNCDSSDERMRLLKTLETTITELKELEKDRMTELGSTMTKRQEVEPEGRKRMASRAGDLLSSAHLDKTDTIRSGRASKGDYVPGVGDLVLTSSIASNIIRRTSKSSGTASQPENRTSGGSHESGYDSQRGTPAPSPSPTNLPYTTPSSITHSSSTRRPLQGRPSTTSAPMALMTPMNPVTRSRSTEQIHLTRVMTITPTLSREDRAKFSSAEDVRVKSQKSVSASSSPRVSKKKERNRSSDKDKKRLTFSSPFHLLRKNRRESSPVEHRSSANRRPRTVSETPSPPPSMDLELSMRSFDGRASAYIVNTT